MRVFRIKELIDAADEGELLLPNFQREFDYDRKAQKDLIISLLSGIPLGSVLTLGGQKEDFASRNIGRKSNIPVESNRDEVRFLLDGQQRISSLWNALSDIYSDNGAKSQLYEGLHNWLKSRWFISFKSDEKFSNDIWGLQFLESSSNIMGELVPDDLAEFVLKTDRVIGLSWNNGLEFPVDQNGMNAEAKEYRKYIQKNSCMPLHLLFEKSLIRPFLKHVARTRAFEIETKIFEWKGADRRFDDLSKEELDHLACAHIREPADWMDFDKERITDRIRDRADSWVDNVLDFFHAVSETSMGVIELDKSYLKKAHVVFDVINKTGKKLSSFDLFCASKPGLDVRAIVDKRVPHMIGLKDSGTDLISDGFTDQLMNLSRIVYAHKSNDFSPKVLKDDSIFSASSEEFADLLPHVIDSLVTAYKFLHENCGLSQISKIPYKLQVLPMAFGFFLANGATEVIGRKLEYVYWITLFSGRYRESQNSRCFKDLEMIRSAFVSESSFEFPEDYKVDSDMWNRVLNDPGYNDLSSLVPAVDEELSDTRESVQKAIMQFVLSRRPVDFPPFSNERLSSSSETEAHHILPLGSASFNSIEESTSALRKNSLHYLNSALNFALISKKSNRKIGSMSYSDYSNHFNPEIFRHYCMPVLISGDTANVEGQLQWLAERHEGLKQKVLTTLQELSR